MPSCLLCEPHGDGGAVHFRRAALLRGSALQCSNNTCIRRGAEKKSALRIRVNIIYIYIICEARLPKPVPRTTTRLGVCSTPLESSSASLGVVWIDRKQMAPKNVSNTHLNVAWCEDQEEVGYYVGRLNRIPLKRIPLNRLFPTKK